jgi:ABC-type dipeptide/oligopeptide/nickel transport system ATPase component
MTQEILIVNNLNTYYPSSLQRETVRLLKNINLIVEREDTVGLVGETGAGKSVLINSVGCNLTSPLWSRADELAINCNGNHEQLLEKDEEEMRAFWGKDIAFIPPNARDRLNPLVRIGKQFSIVLKAKSQLSDEDIHAAILSMFKNVQMPDPNQNLDNYPHELSGGMAQRVVISIAMAMSPNLLLADEPTMGLDVTIQKQVLDLMARLIEKHHSSALLATRDLGIVANYCNKVAVMYDGRILELRRVAEFFKEPLHPYSHFILKAAFATHAKGHGSGSEMPMSDVNGQRAGDTGCPAVKHCGLADAKCLSINPPESQLGKGCYVRCHKPEKL